jgi:predicted porin
MAEAVRRSRAGEFLRMGGLEFASGYVEMEMIGGIMKTTSRLALIAAAGLLIGAVSPATAADLKGGGCCADLEERVAELEATTARKGNRVVSLQVYGQVNKALLIFDDGVDSDAFVVDNDVSSSRLGFTGKATIKPGWSAGFLMEFDVQDSATDKINQLDDEGNANEIAIRHNNVWIESERLGRITIGQGSTAADGAHSVSLSNTLRGAAADQDGGLLVRDNAGNFGIAIKDFASDLDAPRDDVIRYDSPSVYGFILSASWGDDDYADVALRFKKEFNSIRFAAAAAYQWDDRNEADTEIFGGSASIMHVPTGLFLNAAAATRDISDEDGGEMWFVQGGIEKKFLPYGATTFFVDYANYDGIGDGASVDDEDGEVIFGFDNTEATRWGFGVVQKIDSAAMDIYAQAQFWSFDADVNGANADIEDISTFIVGSRIKF